MDSNYEPEQEELEQLTPQKRRKAKTQASTKGDATFRKPRALSNSANTALSVRLECIEKFRELRAIHGKDQGSIHLLQQLDMVQNQHKWHNLVIHYDRPDACCPIEHADPQYWLTYTFTRIEVINKMLDLLYGHIDMIIIMKNQPYRSLFVHTQIEENMDTRILDFIKFLGSPSTKRSKKGNIVVKKWSGEKDVLKWIEIFQVDTVTYQEDEDLLDFRIL